MKRTEKGMPVSPAQTDDALIMLRTSKHMLFFRVTRALLVCRYFLPSRSSPSSPCPQLRGNSAVVRRHFLHVRIYFNAFDLKIASGLTTLPFHVPPGFAMFGRNVLGV